LEAFYQRSFELGFLGSMPIADQIEHALGFVAILEEQSGGPPSCVLDLGTGGGIPGLVLASCWPDTRVVLMDANERRTAFLQEVVDDWAGGGRCQVVRGRAEELGRTEEMREAFDAVTSRSFGPPAATAECGSSFLTVGGAMVISEPPDTALGDRWPTAGLDQLGLARVATLRPVQRFGYQALTKVEPLDVRYPRRVGIPVKRPLF
jgi:16S rRNA (guanine527-N7)-methyltransferase